MLRLLANSTRGTLAVVCVAASSIVYAAPVKHFCDLLPRATAAKLMGEPVTLIVPSPEQDHPIVLGGAGTCSMLGAKHSLIVMLIPLPGQAGKNSPFSDPSRYISSLGAAAQFWEHQNGTQLEIDVLTDDRRALFGVTMAGTAQDIANPSLRPAMIEAVKQALPSIPLYPDPPAH